MVVGTAETSAKKAHTRSRGGCTTCRKRHRRCDEARPSCGYCISADQTCTYPAASIPLRERRAREKKATLPGVQQVWSLTHPLRDDQAASAEGCVTHDKQYLDNVRIIKLSVGSWHAPAAGIDPFQSMAVKMPLNSVPLMRYFFDAASAFDIAVEPRRDCLSRVIHDPAALRSAILLAGVHYAWNTGHLAHYEATYLHHKVENIQTINKQLARPAFETAYLDCVQQIATMAIVEACFGNVPVAEVHFAGLLAYMEKCGESQERTVQQEFADRYVLFVGSFISGLRFYIHDMVANGHRIPAASRDPDKQASAGLEKWLELEERGLYVRMQALRLMPGFLAAPTHVPCPSWPLDVRGELEQLRIMTRCFDRRANAENEREYANVWDEFWMMGAPTELFRTMVDSHANSDWERPKYAEDALLSSWCGMHAAGSLYMTYIVYFPPEDHVMDKRLPKRQLLLVERDLRDTIEDMVDEPASKSAAFWLWKAFVALVSVEHEAKMARHEQGWDVQGRISTFRGFVKQWVAKSGITEWAEAKDMLEVICWPQIPAREHVARILWEMTLK